MGDPQKALQNLTDAMVKDILSLSDDEVMQETLEDLGSQEAVDYHLARIDAMIENARRSAPDA